MIDVPTSVRCACTALFAAAMSSIAADTYYVDAARPGDTGDGLSWATAKQTIASAVALAFNGDTVLVTNGTYSLPAYIEITRNITLRGVSDPTATIIDGSACSRNALLLGDQQCVIDGFTFRNAPSGAIQCSDTTPLVSNCVFTANADSRGGGMLFGTAIDCTFVSNTGNWGGAFHSGTAVSCLFSNNHATFGGGVYGADVCRSVIVSNTAIYGGGIYEGTACNSIIAGNSATEWGGGIRRGAANGCTVVRNVAQCDGGVSGTILRNCIVWDNTAVSNHVYSGSPDTAYTCSPDHPHGLNGNITNAPGFVNLDGGDVRLTKASPCVDAGNHAGVPEALDFAGKARVMGQTIDMGAYECVLTADDQDADGLPDWWEERHYAGPTNANPASVCANRINSVMEAFVANLDPIDASSVLTARPGPSAPGTNVLRWNAVWNRRCTVYRATNVADGFAPVQTGIHWGTDAFTDRLDAAISPAYYRLSLTLDQ